MLFVALHTTRSGMDANEPDGQKKKIGNLFDRHKKIILIVGLAIGVGFLSYQTYECKFLKSCVCVVLRRTSSQRLYVCSLSARKKYT